MFARIRSGISYANVMATLAMFVALASGSYAAATISSNDRPSTTAKKKHKVKAKAGPQGPRGPQGIAGAPGGTGTPGGNGAQGGKGDSGLQGLQGIQGLPGQDGTDGTDASIDGVAAGGDLDGQYPDPTIKPSAVGTSKLDNGAVTPAKLQAPGGFTSAGLGDVAGSCTGFDAWFNISPGVVNSASYYRDPYGTVHLRGVALKCGAATNTVFTLPAGLRPEALEMQVAPYLTGPGRVEINPDGTVVAAISPAAGVWISLDGLTFRCAPSGSNGCP